MPLQHASLYVLAESATPLPLSCIWIAALHGINSREFSRAHSSAIRVRRVGGGRGQRRAFVRLQGKCFIRVRFKKKKGKQLRRVLFPFGQREKTGARPRGNASPVRAPRQKLDSSHNPPPSGSRERRLCTLPVGHPPGGTRGGCDRAGGPSICRELGVTRQRIARGRRTHREDPQRRCDRSLRARRRRWRPWPPTARRRGARGRYAWYDARRNEERPRQDAFNRRQVPLVVDLMTNPTQPPTRQI